MNNDAPITNLTLFLQPARIWRPAVKAAMDSILFLSSPAQSLAVTPPHVQTVPMSSSPSLPSPSQLFTIKATTIPCTRLEESNGGDVITGFTSAADLLRQVRKSEMRLDCLSEEKEGLGVYADFESRESENIIVKELATKENDHLMVKKAKGSRKSSTKSGKKTTGGDENWSKPEELILSEPQADKKKRSKRSKEETQTKIKKGGITKPAINKSTRKRTKLVKSKATSGHETKPIVDTIEQTITYAPGEEPLDLALVEAIKRRRAWTPVKDTLQKSSRSSEASAKILPDSEGSSAILDVSKGDNLFGEYKYAQKADDRSVGFENARSMNREVLVKRRKLDVCQLKEIIRL